MVWHHGLTKAQFEQLEAIQRHAIQLVFEVTFNMPYQLAIAFTNVSSLQARKEQLNKKIFRKIMNISDNLLSDLLASPRETTIIG